MITKKDFEEPVGSLGKAQAGRFIGRGLLAIAESIRFASQVYYQTVRGNNLRSLDFQKINEQSELK